jgi:hypothetical protein
MESGSAQRVNLRRAQKEEVMEVMKVMEVQKSHDEHLLSDKSIGTRPSG